MPVYKDKNGTWYVMTRCDDWQGQRKQKCKRGFATRRDALEWEKVFQMQTTSDLDMSFEAFVELYKAERQPRLKQTTWMTKEHIINTKILPYFGKRRISEIQSKDVIAWQNKLLLMKDENGKPYSPVYLKTIHNQLSAIFNHAVRYYNLRSNPAAKAGNMGSEERTEMLFWTKAEYLKFAEAMMDKPLSYYAFEVLYWCGVRMGELLALTPADIDLEKGTISVTKNYQRIAGQDIITTPKTPKSNRVITIPNGLRECLRDYMAQCYELQPGDRIFPYTKSFLDHEMENGCKRSGVKKIRIHDLRHSHASLLVEMGFSPLLIAERLGHERVQTTMETYSHLYPNKQTEVANRLDGVMG